MDSTDTSAGSPAAPPPPPLGGTSSRQLLSRAQRGDRSALNAIIDRHLGPLQRWARGRLPRWARAIEDTADLVQEAVLHTLRKLGSFEPQGKGALQGYMRRAVDNRITDEFRRIARRGTGSVLDEAFPDPGPSPHEETVARDLEERYRAALKRLRHTDRRLIVARVELGYSIEQLALMTDRRPATARVALRRALERLAAEMDRE